MRQNSNLLTFAYQGSSVSSRSPLVQGVALNRVPCLTRFPLQGSGLESGLSSLSMMSLASSLIAYHFPKVTRVSGAEPRQRCTIYGTGSRIKKVCEDSAWGQVESSRSSVECGYLRYLLSRISNSFANLSSRAFNESLSIISSAKPQTDWKLFS